MPLKINEVDYVTAAEAAEASGVSRQTLWRWRAQGVVPAGRTFRDRQVVFSAEEADQIRQYANRLGPSGVRPSRVPTAVEQGDRR